MARPQWLLVAMMAYTCAPGFGSACLKSSVCQNLRSERRIQNCIQLCIKKIQAELSRHNKLAVKTEEENDLLFNIILAIQAQDQGPESGLEAHGNSRRSYSMEHFRWGKPSGRKRRPIKIFLSSLEGGGSSSESGLKAHARRQAGSAPEDEARSNQNQQRAKVKAQAPLSPQDRKAGSYRMSHFRWSNPTTWKRNVKSLEDKHKAELAHVLRNILHKKVQSIMG